MNKKIVCPECKDTGTVVIDLTASAPLEINKKGNVVVGYADDKPQISGSAFCYVCGNEYLPSEYHKLIS